MRKIRYVLIAFVLFVFSTSIIHAQEPKLRRHVLDNGMIVLVAEKPDSPTIATYLLVKTGSATEGEFLGSGISHFIEHMFFKGTKKRPVGTIGKEVKGLGGYINASTSFDYTKYTIELPAGKFSQAIDIMSDMMLNAEFDPEEVEKERKVIHSEMRMIEDRPNRKLSELAFRTAFKRHPYRHPIIGYRNQLDQITRDDLVTYFNNHYFPNNMILAVGGDITLEEVLPEIRAVFEDVPSKGYAPRHLPQEPAQIVGRWEEHEYHTELTRASVIYQGVSILDEDMYALDVLAIGLGQGASSRLYLDIYKKKRMVESIRSSNFTPIDRGAFEVEFLLPEGKTNLNEVIDEVNVHIEAIKAKGLTKEELDKAKRKVLSGKIFGMQTAQSLATGMAFDEYYTGDYLFSDKYVDQIRQVTNDDIIRVAQKYLVDRSRSVVILKPKVDEADEVSKTESEKKEEIEKVVLDNGITLLLKEEHSLPIFSINLVVNAGSRHETEELNGLTYLASKLWGSGTKKLTTEEISKEVEARGGSVTQFAGRNSMGVQMSFLSEDFDFAINLLEDIVKNPTFPEKEIQKLKDGMNIGLTARDYNIVKMGFKELRETLFETHPFRLDQLGTQESIERLSRDDVVDYVERYVAPNNMVISVFGDINADEVEALISKKFGGLKQKEVNLPKYSEDPPNNVRLKELILDKEQALVVFGFHGPTLYEQDHYGIEVITSILGSGLSGRLFTSIRDKLGKAYAMGSNYQPGLDSGMIYFYALTDKDNVEKVREIIEAEIQLLHNDLVTDDELLDSKEYLIGNFYMDLDTISRLSFSCVLDELYGLGYNNYVTYRENIDGVNKSAIRTLAQKYLDTNKMAVVIVRPPEGDE